MAFPGDHEVIQIAGGSAETIRQYIGYPREITVNIDDWTLSVHDGVTPGGQVVLSLAQGSASFQLKDSDLDALSAFAPLTRGLLVRRADGNWAVRQIVDGADLSLSITNPNGYGGNIDIRLKDVIGGARRWTGTQTFDLKIEASGGLEGNTEGTHTGPSNGVHTGDQVGSVDVRGHTLQLDDDQVTQAKVAGLTEALAGLAGQIKPGMILMWSGDSTNVPDGWFICDGQNATPNLLDKFIVAAGSDRPPHDTGGSDSHTHTTTAGAGGVHQHSVTVDDTVLSDTQMPAHSHMIMGSSGEAPGGPNIDATHVAGRQRTSAGDSDYRITADNANVANAGPSSSTGGGLGHNHTASTADSPSHTHTMSTSSTTQVPAYYSLAFIMKAA